MTLSALAVWIHVLIVFWLVAGILARDRCYERAARTDDLQRLDWLIEMGGHFERSMVRPATFAVLVAGLIAAWARGWPILGFLQGGSSNWVLASLLIYLSIIPVIFFVFIPRGRVFRAALDEAKGLGHVTPRLKAALGDRAVAAARTYELLMIGAITALMVTRSF
ncbi:MAG: DUF2269 family protein [Candidatus Eisenbacteria bacterium]